MLRQGLGEDEDVVEVNTDDTERDEVVEDFVHHGLEGGGAVGQSEVHDEGFEQAAVGAKRRFPLVAFADANVVVAPADVELREVFRAFETMDEVVDEGEGVAVLSRDEVERAIVLYESQLTVLIFDEEDRCADRRFRLADATRAEGFLEERVEFALLLSCHRVDLAKSG